MCRIAGIVNTSSNSLTEGILLMRDAMHRGGPDDAGIFIDEKIGLALGHRRLALLDLSNAGHQPMFSKCSNISIVFNGEIYNFIQIKEELEKEGFIFVTKTDTEVIINSYIHWGKKCFERFNGMFALAIWDSVKNELILARDYAGIKPLYYHSTNTQFLFASEVRAFKALDPDWEENDDWKIPFLAYGHLPEPFTTLQDVLQLPKGCYAVVNLKDISIQITPFYFSKYTSSVVTTDSAIKLLRNKVEKAVERHLVSDAPIGVFLSGGIDSSIITLLASKYSTSKIKTLSIVFEEQDFSEEIYQKMVVEQTNVEHHSFLVTNQMFRDEFEQIMEAMDQPSIDGINTYFICKFAKQYGLTAVLSGLGADELLGGYDSARRSQLLKKITKLPYFVLALTSYLPNDKIKRISYLKEDNLLNKYLFYRGIYNPLRISALLNVPLGKVLSVLKKVTVVPHNSMSEIQEAAHLEQHLYMQNQLLKDTDYMSMWHGIEVRVPFLDKEVIEACNSIATEIKFSLNKRPKYLLIQAFQDILPSAIWNRKKQGFTFPFTKWINHVVPLNRGTVFEKKYRDLNNSVIHWSKYWTYVLATNSPQNLIFLPKKFDRVCFYNTSTFATMGGIEKFNRALLHGLSTLEQDSLIIADAASMYDKEVEVDYFRADNYRLYKKNKLSFVWNELRSAYKYNQIILGHVNLALFGLLIKFFNPSIKVYLVAHGIEVWGGLTGLKKKILEKCDAILAVSNYTKQKLIEVNKVEASKVSIFHNTIDPFFRYPKQFVKPSYLLDRYGIKPNEKIILTLTRLSYTEKYKGYDKVIAVLPEIIKSYPSVKYLIAGKPDELEKNRLTSLISQYKLEKQVFLVGFIADEEISDHYQLADVFVMPSKKEGFGIVFIEAMACGLPVIAGNQDGSVDALKNGELGMLVNPEDKEQMISTVLKVLSGNSYTSNQKEQLQKRVDGYFGFPVFKQNLKTQLVH